jgi:hypothetical protein
VQTYFVWVCAGRILSQPDAKRSSVIEEKILNMGLYFVLDPQKTRGFFEMRFWNPMILRGQRPEIGSFESAGNAF